MWSWLFVRTPLSCVIFLVIISNISSSEEEESSEEEASSSTGVEEESRDSDSYSLTISGLRDLFTPSSYKI